jgi:2-methylcitrate dehydratase PrpD
MTLAERLAAFAASLEFDDLPPAVVAAARMRTLDVLGVALAAATQDFAVALARTLEGWAAGGEATVIGGKQTAPVPLAVLANGTLAHALDFDDTHPAAIVHVSSVIVPTVLAVAEAARADGRTVLAAAVAGGEAMIRLGLAASGAFHARGWHATGVGGALGAALAAGRVQRLDATRLAAALGLAGSFASGLLEFLSDGSAAKRVHAGWAGHAGVVAAALAAHGFAGPTTVLEGRFGLYAAMLGAPPAPEPFETLGREWQTLRIAVKPYPCCHLLHAYLDCALALRQAHGIVPEAIEAVECRVPAGEVPIVCEPAGAKRSPRTPYEAQFSLPFTVAAALVDGRVGLETFSPERLADPRIAALAARVRDTVDPSARYPETFPGWVRIHLADGRLVEAREPDGRGGPERPLPPAAVVEKFRDNAARALPPARVERLEAAVLALDTLADAGEVLRLCRP